MKKISVTIKGLKNKYREVKQTMTRNKNKIAKLLAVTGLVFVSAVPLAHLDKAGAAGSTNVTLHKLAYQNNVTEVKNTGNEMNLTAFGNEVRAWNKNKDGIVKFTAYKLNKDQLKTDKKPQVIADEVARAVEANGGLPYGATKVGTEVEVDGAGNINFNNLEDGTYVFVETTAAGTVTQKAKPMLVSLPTSNADGRANLGNIHLYPKNKVKQVEVSFKKYLQKFGEATPTLLQTNKAGFTLYKGEPGRGTKVENSYQDLTSGTITVTDLEVGKYYFVEESKLDASKPNNGPEDIIYDGDVANKAGNKLTFEYTADGRLTYPTDSLLKEGMKVVNYQKPHIDKTVDRVDVAFDEDITYTIKTEVPTNVAKYTKYEITDTPSNAITVNRQTIKVEAVNSTGAKIKDIPFTVKDAANGGFTVVPTLTVVQALPNGTSLKVTYTGQLNKAAATVDTNLPNTARLDYDNNVVVDKGEDTENVKTFEASLKKVDAGLFNSGAVKQALSGAKFILAQATGTESNTITKYLKVEAGKYTWVTDKAQATEFDTGQDGMLNVKGLKNGHYFFVETKAPEGYNINTNPFSHFEINNASIKDATKIEVSNARRSDMPITGTETTVLVLAGLAGATVVAVVVRRRREDRKEA